MVPADVHRAVNGQDAVAVTLGITENPLLVRLRGTRGTPLDVRSRGTKNVIDAMRAQGVDKLVVQSTYGIGESKGRLPLKWRMIFSMLLKPQILDSEEQERIVRDSGLDWTLVQPVGLTDDEDAAAFVSTDGDTQTMNVSRASVARLLAEALESSQYRGASVAISAARAEPSTTGSALPRSLR